MYGLVILLYWLRKWQVRPAMLRHNVDDDVDVDEDFNVDDDFDDGVDDGVIVIDINIVIDIDIVPKHSWSDLPYSQPMQQNHTTIHFSM